jgi:hypothetical protein
MEFAGKVAPIAGAPPGCATPPDRRIALCETAVALVERSATRSAAAVVVTVLLILVAAVARGHAQAAALDCSRQGVGGNQTCVQIPPLAPVTLHQFGTDDQQLDPTNTYISGDLGACNRRSLVVSAAPIECLVTDWFNVRSYDGSVTPTFQIGGNWAAGDRVGIDAWIGDPKNPTGALAEYRVWYTVQPPDVAGGGNMPAAYAHILKGLVGTDQSGIGDGGCVNGTGGYHPDGRVPAAPAHCSGTSAFLAAMAHFPDGGPIAGNGYRPQAFATGPYFITDFPWGDATTGVFAAHPAVNVLTPSAVSAAGTFTVLQRTNANLHQQLFASSGGVLDNGPIASLRRSNNGRTPQAGDMLSSYRIDLQNTTDGKSGFAGPAFVAGVDGLTAIVAAAGGDRLVLQAAPTGPPSLMAEFAADGKWYAADNSWACAIPMNAIVAGWDPASLTITLSRKIDAAPPCPGVAKGDLVSFVDGEDARAISGIAGPGGTPVIFFGEGFVTTGTTGPNQACEPPPGYGSGIICGSLKVEGGAASISTTTGALTVKGGLGIAGAVNMAGCNVNGVPCATTRIPTASKTARYAVQPVDSGTAFDNAGATGEVDFLLPTEADGLNFCFTVIAPHALRIIAPAPASIAIGAGRSPPGGKAEAVAPFSSLCLFSPHGARSQWVAKSATGHWRGTN